MSGELITEIWRKYENCRNYMDGKALVSKTEQYWDFYGGNQWRGVQSAGEVLPILNFIKPNVQYKVATIVQNSMTAVFSDVKGREEMKGVTEALNSDFANKWARAKMDKYSWRACKAAAIQGDSYLYFGTEDVKDVQIIMNTNIFFGNEQERDIQNQPFIIIYERVLCEEARSKAKENGVPEEEIRRITPDEQTQYQVGSKLEVKGTEKCSSILYLEKKDGKVYTARSTAQCVYEPLRMIGSDDVAMSLYPIVNWVWEEMPNSARGNSEVAQLLPNQIELNRTLARRSQSVKMTAYPRIAYDATAIANPEDLDRVGASIGMQGAAGNIDQLIKYLNPASMSHDAESLQKDLLASTRELAGSGDSVMGNINPEQASGEAIKAVRDQQEIPLNEHVATYKQFTEDVAKLWYEMNCVYSPNGIEVSTTDEDGNIIHSTITGDQLLEIEPEISIDVSKDNPWSKFAEQQELAALLDKGMISFEEYVEASPENSSLPVNKLRSILKKRKEQQAMQEEAPVPDMNQPKTDDEYMQMLMEGGGQVGGV